MPVTATEISITFKAPPYDVFGIQPILPEDALRFRIWPETAVSWTLHGKKPGASLEAQAQELTFAQQPGEDIRPYDRLIGAALDGERWLFARQDTVEAAWDVVDPILNDVVPVHPYAKGTWGPTEAERLRIFTAAQLARATLDRGLALNVPEAVALICDEMHLAARAGGSWEDVRDAGMSVAALPATPDVLRPQTLPLGSDKPRQHKKWCFARVAPAPPGQP